MHKWIYLYSKYKCENMEKFKELGIIEPILKSIEEQKFEEPTEIQVKTIPLVLEGKDVIAMSKTGSGKTLAFGCGIIDKVKPDFGIQAIVLTPTRELAIQIAKNLKEFSKYKKMHIATIYGGVSIIPQIKELYHTEVVIGTPGRMLDHIRRGTINLKQVNTIVLDEADRMFEMGFIEDVKAIMIECPKKRQTLLFSATMNDDVIKIAKQQMDNPIRISCENQVDPKKLKQIYYDVNDKMKFSLLYHLLKNEDESKLNMVFCNTQRATDFVADNLNRNEIHALAIHGGLSQERRKKVMDEFHGKKVSVLVCTDVAARGLDIKEVSHVYNYDIPNEPNQYIHRIGRTARAGEEGIAISLLSQRDYDNFSYVLKETGVTIQKMEKPFIDLVNVVMHQNRRRFAPRGQSQGRRFGNKRPGNSNWKERRSGGGEEGSQGRREGGSSWGVKPTVHARRFGDRGNSRR